jgi:hypothetical protein
MSGHEDSGHHEELRKSTVADPAQDDLRLYSPTETAQRLGWNETTLRRKAGRREIPSTKSGRYLMFSLDNIKQIIQMTARPARPPERRRRRGR